MNKLAQNQSFNKEEKQFDNLFNSSTETNSSKSSNHDLYARATNVVDESPATATSAAASSLLIRASTLNSQDSCNPKQQSTADNDDESSTSYSALVSSLDGLSSFNDAHQHQHQHNSMKYVNNGTDLNDSNKNFTKQIKNILEQNITDLNKQTTTTTTSSSTYSTDSLVSNASSSAVNSLSSSISPVKLLQQSSSSSPKIETITTTNSGDNEQKILVTNELQQQQLEESQICNREENLSVTNLDEFEANVRDLLFLHDTNDDRFRLAESNLLKSSLDNNSKSRNLKMLIDSILCVTRQCHHHDDANDGAALRASKSFDSQTTSNFSLEWLLNGVQLKLDELKSQFIELNDLNEQVQKLDVFLLRIAKINKILVDETKSRTKQQTKPISDSQQHQLNDEPIMSSIVIESCFDFLNHESSSSNGNDDEEVVVDSSAATGSDSASIRSFSSSTKSSSSPSNQEKISNSLLLPFNFEQTICIHLSCILAQLNGLDRLNVWCSEQRDATKLNDLESFLLNRINAETSFLKRLLDLISLDLNNSSISFENDCDDESTKQNASNRMMNQILDKIFFFFANTTNNSNDSDQVVSNMFLDRKNIWLDALDEKKSNDSKCLSECNYLSVDLLKLCNSLATHLNVDSSCLIGIFESGSLFDCSRLQKATTISIFHFDRLIRLLNDDEKWRTLLLLPLTSSHESDAIEMLVEKPELLATNLLIESIVNGTTSIRAEILVDLVERKLCDHLISISNEKSIDFAHIDQLISKLEIKLNDDDDNQDKNLSIDLFTNQKRKVNNYRALIEHLKQH